MRAKNKLSDEQGKHFAMQRICLIKKDNILRVTNEMPLKKEHILHAKNEVSEHQRVRAFFHAQNV